MEWKQPHCVVSNEWATIYYQDLKLSFWKNAEKGRNVFLGDSRQPGKLWDIGEAEASHSVAMVLVAEASGGYWVLYALPGEDTAAVLSLPPNTLAGN